jgi:VCBS repeat protein
LAVLVAVTATALALSACGGSKERSAAPKFAGPRIYRTDPGGTLGLAVGDLDGDGVADVVVASDPISVYRNRGDGRLRTPRNYAATADPQSVAIGDLNGDGKPDLAVGDGAESDYSVAVLLNRGDGMFGRRRLYRAGEEPGAVAIADLDGDGKPDLAAGSCYEASVSVLKNRGDGTFGRRRAYRTAGSEPCSVALGDITGDGEPDLVTANQVGHESVSLLVNNGDGTFAATHAIRIPQFAPDFVRIADLDGDGKPELIVSALADNLPFGQKVFVLRREGAGKFAPSRSYRTKDVPFAVGDLNGDGLPELVSASADVVAVFANRGDGTFTAPRTYHSGIGVPDEFASGVAIGDLSPDGRPDLVVEGESLSVISNATH